MAASKVICDLRCAATSTSQPSNSSKAAYKLASNIVAMAMAVAVALG